MPEDYPSGQAAMWVYADRTHPVYSRPPGADRWPAALEGQIAPAFVEVPDPNDDEADALVAEELRLQTAHAPSVELYQEDGTGFTVQKIGLRTRYINTVDDFALEGVAQEWLAALKALSLGPYSLRDLRLMGHPYGREGAPAWSSLKTPRKVPSMARLRHAGLGRGRVPDLSVVNRQSGQFEASWRFALKRWGTAEQGGIDVLFWNEAKSSRGAPYPWFLARGTIRMQAHGPWHTVAERLLERLREAWRTETAAAARRQRATAAVLGEHYKIPWSR